MIPATKKKPGIRRRLTEEQARAVAFTGITPLAFLLQVMRDIPPKQRPDEDDTVYRLRIVRSEDRALEAAKFAAPYVHPKLQSIEHKGDADNPVNLNLRVTFV